MAVATFYPPGRTTEWASLSERAEAVARLVSATAAHALYAKSQLGAPVHALRRAHARVSAASTSDRQACDPDIGQGVAIARPLVRPGPRAGNQVLRAELLSTLDLLESSLRSALSAGMHACPDEQEVDVAFLFGPGLLFPKHLFGMTIVLPAASGSKAKSKSRPNPRPKGSGSEPALGLGGTPALRTKAQEARPDDRLKMIERRLLAFLVEHDTLPGEEDLSLPSSHADGICEPLSLSHPSCDKIKKRAMKCHVALRARPAFVDAAIAGQSAVPDQPPAWVHRPAFHPRGLDQLFDPPTEHAVPGTENRPPLAPPPVRPRSLRSWIPHTRHRAPSPDLMPSSDPPDPPSEPSISSIRIDSPPPADRSKPERACGREAEPAGAGTGTPGPSSPSRSSISWSGVVAGCSADAGRSEGRVPTLRSSPPRPYGHVHAHAHAHTHTHASALNSTPLRAPLRDPTGRARPWQSPLSLDSSPPSLEVSLSGSGVGVGSVSLPSRDRRRRKGGPVCGRMRLDLRRAPPPRTALPIYHDSDESDQERDAPSPRPEDGEQRAWAVFTPPLLGGGVGL